MLTSKEREWILSERARYTREETGSKRLKDYKIRNKAKAMIKDLSFMAKELAPDQHRQVFTRETLLELAEAFHAYSTKEKERFKGDNDAIVCNKELFYLGVEMSNSLLSMARNLVSERYYRLIWGMGRRLLPQEKETDALTRIYYEIKYAET
ncbi:hypothetical protein D4R42_05475 [bacterium]|nr:MAG: hypothetical protein D4R42_05475 [bacterium]